MSRLLRAGALALLLPLHAAAQAPAQPATSAEATRAGGAIATAEKAVADAAAAGAQEPALAASRSALAAARTALAAGDADSAGKRADEAFSLAATARGDAEAAGGKRTRFSVETVPGGAAVAGRGGGAVEVSGGGSTVTIAPGEGAGLGAGAPRKRALLAAPEPSAPKAGELLLLAPVGRPAERTGTLRWGAIQGATGYRVVVTRAGKRLFRASTSETELSVPLSALGEGRYSWTVTALDSSGAEGRRSASLWFAVEVEPPPPTTLEVGKRKWE